jgi:uncharacterized membrane protein
MTTAFSILIEILIAGIYFLMPSLVFPTLPFGVRVPLAYARHPAVMEERRRYTLRLEFLTGLVILVEGGFWLFTQGSLFRPLGILTLVIGCWAVYYLSHRRLAQVKADQQWFADTRQAVMALAAPRPAAPSRLFRVLLALCGGLIFLTGWIAVSSYPAMPGSLHFAMPGSLGNWDLVKSPLNAFLPVIFQIVFSLFFAGFAWLRASGRQSIDVEDPAASQRQEQLTLQIIQALLLLLAVGFNIAFLLAGLMGWGLLQVNPSLIPWMMLAPLAGWLSVAPVLLLGLQTQRRSSPAGTTPFVNRDDDRFWKLGIFYVNRDDPAVLVNKRFGIGRTLNLGHPLSWVIVLALAAFIAFRVLTRQG